MYDELIERLHKRIALTTAGSPLQDDLKEAAGAIEALEERIWRGGAEMNIRPVVYCMNCRFREECAFDADDYFFCASGEPFPEFPEVDVPGAKKDFKKIVCKRCSMRIEVACDKKPYVFFCPNCGAKLR